MIGRVTSTKLKNTATVIVERTAMHPLYKKTFIRTKKYLVDDLIGVKDGDIVEITKCRPVSKNKHWKVVKVVGQDLAEIVETQQKIAAEEVIAEVMPEEPVKSVDQSDSAETPKTDKSKTKLLKKEKVVK